MSATIARTAQERSRLARHRWPVSLRYVFARLLSSSAAVLGAVSLVFFLILLTGNPARLMLPEDASADEVARLSAAMGFDQPLPVQYLRFIGGVFTGEFPASIRTGVPAFELVWERVPATLLLTGTGLALGAAVGLLIGSWSAYRHGRPFSYLPIRVVAVLQAVPEYLLAILLILVFAVWFRLVPTSGLHGPESFWLPLAATAVQIIPGIARLSRAGILEQSQADHVLTAIAKGVEPRRVRFHHITVNSLPPVIAYIGLHLGGIIGGAVVIESVFAWPGVGQLIVNAVNGKDYPVALAAVTLVAVGYVVASFFVDLLIKVVDPKTELEGER